MKTKHILVLSLIIALPVIFFSCKKSKSCPATSLDNFPAFPYNPNQKIVFKDSLDHEITVTMNASFTNHQAYDLTTKDPMKGPTGNEYCGAQTALESQGTSTDSLFGDEFAQIRVEYKKFIEGPDKNQTQFNIAGLYQVYISGTINEQSGTRSFDNYTNMLATYKTPYKTYQNVFENIPLTDPSQSWKRLVFDGTGRILSFNIKDDTTRFFYLVE